MYLNAALAQLDSREGRSPKTECLSDIAGAGSVGEGWLRKNCEAILPGMF